MKKLLLPLGLVTSLAFASYISTGGGSGSSTWGSITGTLSNQTDLNSALSAKGDFSGPGSSVNGDMVTMNGTGGKTGRSESKFNVAPTTGVVTQSFTGSPSGALHTIGLGTADTWTSGLKLNGTLASAATNIFPLEIAPSRALSGGLGYWGIYHHPSFSSSSSGQFFGIYNYMQASSTGNGQGAGNNNSVLGITGGLFYGMNDSNQGSGLGLGAFSYGNKTIGVRGYSYSIGGSTPRAVGVLGTAGLDNSATSVGVYAVICPTGSGSTCETYTNPGASAALIGDSKDSSTPAIIGMNSTTNVFQVSGAGATTIGASGGSAIHRINGATQATSAGSLTLTNGPGASTGNPAVYLEININGTNYVIPAWTF